MRATLAEPPSEGNKEKEGTVLLLRREGRDLHVVVDEGHPSRSLKVRESLVVIGQRADLIASRYRKIILSLQDEEVGGKARSEPLDFTLILRLGRDSVRLRRLKPLAGCLD